MLKNLTLIILLLLSSLSHAQLFTCFDIDTVKYMGSAPCRYSVANGKLFFHAKTAQYGDEWYVSDGTPGGTQLLKDINPGIGNSSVTEGIEYNGKFYFYAMDGVNGSQLWATDGTTNGTYMVANVNGNGSTSSNAMIVYNNLLYFTPFHSTYGCELWATDGTATNTHLIKDVNTGIGDSYPGRFAILNNKLYFVAQEPVNGRAIWETDGTEPGTKVAVDIDTAQYPLIRRPIVMNSKMFFLGHDSTGMHLWSSDCTQNGTVKITTDSFMQTPSNDHPIVCNNKLYFTAELPGETEKLWVSDGTATGTKSLAQINTTQNFHGELIAFKNKVYFSGTSDGFKFDLWETDGTDTGTYITSTNTTSIFGLKPENFIEYNNYLYFVGNTKNWNDRHLWRTDGDNIELVDSSLTTYKNPLQAPSISQYEEGFAVYNNALYFTAAYDTVRSYEMWSFKDTPVVNNIPQQITTKHNNLIIYPNPNNGDFTLQLPDGTKGDATVSVYDMTGRCVYTQQITTPAPKQAGNHNKTQQLHLTGKPTGIYQLKLQITDGVYTSRLVLQ